MKECTSIKDSYAIDLLASIGLPPSSPDQTSPSPAHAPNVSASICVQRRYPLALRCPYKSHDLSPSTSFAFAFGPFLNSIWFLIASMRDEFKAVRSGIKEWQR